MARLGIILGQKPPVFTHHGSGLPRPRICPLLHLICTSMCRETTSRPGRYFLRRSIHQHLALLDWRPRHCPRRQVRIYVSHSSYSPVSCWPSSYVPCFHTWKHYYPSCIVHDLVSRSLGPPDASLVVNRADRAHWYCNRWSQHRPQHHDYHPCSFWTGRRVRLPHTGEEASMPYRLRASHQPPCSTSLGQSWCQFGMNVQFTTQLSFVSSRFHFLMLSSCSRQVPGAVFVNTMAPVELLRGESSQLSRPLSIPLSCAPPSNCFS